MTWTFDQFELDHAYFELRQEGAPVAVPPKALALLMYIVGHAHRSVPRSELLAVMWPGVAVTHGALNQTVRSLRRILGPASGERIRTVRGYGYRWVP